jgi:TolB protein
MQTRLLVLFLALLLPCAAFAQTDIYLQTEKSGAGEIPIVVRELEPKTAPADQTARYITNVLCKDLEFTDIFDPIRVTGAIDSLPDGGTAAALFEGSVEAAEGSFVLEARLLDFSSREVIFNKRYRFERDARRTVAHRLADEIAYFLIGERGIATTRLLFCRRDGDNKNLMIVDYDGHGERRITKNELAVSPVWIDEQRFCYTSYKRGNPDCYLIDLRRGKRFLISHRKGLNVAGDYFPGRDEIAMTLSVSGNSEIYLITSAGKIERRLTRNRAIDCSPAWAPNGNEIAFVSDRSRTPQIYVIDRFGGGVRRLTRRGSYNTSPSWSPLGDEIAYASREANLYRLKLITPDGMAEETLFDDYLSYEDPVWAPDGRHLAATVRYGGDPWIVVIDTESRNKRRLVQGESAAWSPLPAGGE